MTFTVSEELGVADSLRDVCGNRSDPVSYGLGIAESVAKGLDVDKPRNLAKSVTVE